MLAEGDRVPADALLRAAQDLEADELLLTGESVPVRKAARTALHPMRRGRAAMICPSSIRAPHRARHGHCRGHRDGSRSEIGKIGQSLGDSRRSRRICRTQTRQLVQHLRTGRRGRQHRSSSCSTDVPRRLAPGGPGGHRRRHVDAAGGVSGRPDGLHGDGGVAHLPGPRPHPPRQRHRGAGVGDGAVHRQDRNADREPHDDRRTPAAGRGARHVDASNAPSHAPLRGADRTALLASAPILSTRWKRPFMRCATEPDPAEQHGYATSSKPRPAPRLPRDDPCLATARGGDLRGCRQGCAGGHRRTLPPDPDGTHWLHAGRRCDGGAGPPCAGRCPRRLRQSDDLPETPAGLRLRVAGPRGPSRPAARGCSRGGCRMPPAGIRV